jgi:hypothetical protein
MYPPVHRTMKPGLIAHLVTKELHYCCEFRFFSLYRRTGLIAERLGVSPQAVRARRRLFLAGGMKCAGCPTCQRPVR